MIDTFYASKVNNDVAVCRRRSLSFRSFVRRHRLLLFFSISFFSIFFSFFHFTSFVVQKMFFLLGARRIGMNSPNCNLMIRQFVTNIRPGLKRN